MTQANRRKMSALELRSMAEAADGHRGKLLSLIYRKPNPADHADLGEFAAVTPEELQQRMANGQQLEVLHEIESPFENTNRRERSLQSVRYVTPTGKEVHADEADSLFWSESAVSKFVWAYYIRLWPKPLFDAVYRSYLRTQDELKQGKDKPGDPSTIYGFIHYPPSIYKPVFGDGASLPPIAIAILSSGLHVITSEGSVSLFQYVVAFHQELLG